MESVKELPSKLMMQPTWKIDSPIASFFEKKTKKNSFICSGTKPGVLPY